MEKEKDCDGIGHLKIQIENLKLKLYKALENTQELNSDDVMMISRQLDQLIVKYIVSSK